MFTSITGIIISIIGVVVVFGMIIFSHELGHFLMAKKMGVRVEAFSLGFGPSLWSVTKNGTEYKICLVPLGGYVKMAGEEPGEERTGAEWEFFSKPVGKRFNILIAGAAANYIIGIFLFCIIFLISPTMSSRIGEVMEGYPAEEAGLMENDGITKISGWDIRHWIDVLRVLAISEDDVSVEVERGGEILEFEVTKRTEEMEGASGRLVKRKVIGIAPSEELLTYNFFGSIAMGIRETLFLTRFTFRVIGQLFTGALPIKTVSGPVGIFAVTGQAARVGVIPLLKISALISVSIAIFNLLPFPPLDGGHILFLGIEKLKGRPVDQKVQGFIQQAGWILLLTLILVVSWNDIIGLFK